MLIARPRAAATETVFTAVMGAQVLFAPIDRAMLRRARRSAMAAVGRAEGDVASASASVSDHLEDLGEAFSHALIVEGARDWRDVATQRIDDDGAAVIVDGEPVFDALDFSRENLELVLSDPIAFEAFDAAYVVPFVTAERERSAPGNASAASPSGTGEAATRASGIASSAAAPRRKGGAKRARTASTKPRPTPKKTSGAS